MNYLAGFLLTRLLLPLLRTSAPSRIVSVASVGQHPIDFDDVMLTRGYDGWRAYMQSKLAQVMFTVDLAGELAGSGVTATCLHPATYMDTTMVREGGLIPRSTVGQGAEAILNLALSSALEGQSGLYFDGLRRSRPNPQADDAAARRRLRRLSLSLVGLPDESVSAPSAAAAIRSAWSAAIPASQTDTCSPALTPRMVTPAPKVAARASIRQSRRCWLRLRVRRRCRSKCPSSISRANTA